MQEAYTIQLERLEEAIREALEAGYNAMVVINGEYYSVERPEMPERER